MILRSATKRDTIVRPHVVCTSLMMLCLAIILSLKPLKAEETRKGLNAIKFQTENQEGYLPISEFQSTAHELGLKPDDIRLRSLFSPTDRKKLIKIEEQTPRYTPPKLGEEKIFAHVKKSGGGEEVISLEKVLAPHLKMVEDRKEEFKQIAINHLKKQQENVKKSFYLEPLPRCDADKTERTDFPEAIPGKEDGTIGDFLFVPPKYQTTNAKDIFGEQTQVIVYDTSKRSVFTLVAKAYRVKCLPYRVRATGQHLYEHYGEDALRNYDGDPNGKGEKIL